MAGALDPPADEAAPQGELRPEVKTLTFVTLRGFLPGHLGDEAYEELRGHISAPTLELIDNADPYDWMDEAHMHELMRLVYQHVLASDDDAYMDFARALALAGISRFLKIFLSLATERFVLRNIPVVWKRLRRNAGTVVAETEGELIRLSYDGFPYFSDRVYRLLSLANCQALVYAATNRLPLGHIKHWSKESLILEFELRDV